MRTPEPARAAPSDGSAPVFHHSASGTPEHRWLLDPRWGEVAAFEPEQLMDGRTRVVVLAAHPDDETLGVGATLVDLAAAGAAVDVVVATDGEASHPDSTLWPPARLAEARRAEVAHALRVLAPHARQHLLALPDGRLGQTPGLAGLLRERLPDVDERTLLLAPLREDGHPDHDALGAAAADLAAATGARLLHYPLWRWHWGAPEGLDWPALLAITPSAAALRSKREAIRAHATQVAPLSPLPGDETLLPSHVLARFERVVEVLVAGSPEAAERARAARLQRERRDRRTAEQEALADDDPWDEQSWYERRKRDLSVAVLARERYGDVLDVGCSTGAFTAVLSRRADAVVAIDPSERALAVARARGLPGVRWCRGEAPYDLPDEPVDLVVASEIGYFLTGAELLGLLRHAARVLRPGGEVLLIHWRRRTRGIPLDGELVHDQARRLYDGVLRHRAHYVDADVRIDCWGGPERLGPDRGAE